MTCNQLVACQCFVGTGRGSTLSRALLRQPANKAFARWAHPRQRDNGEVARETQPAQMNDRPAHMRAYSTLVGRPASPPWGHGTEWASARDSIIVLRRRRVG